MPPKRPRTAEEENGTSPNTPLSLSEVRKLALVICGHRDTLLGWLANERDTDRKCKLRQAINDICDLYFTISNAYVGTLTAESCRDICVDFLERACTNIEQATAALTSQATAISQEASKRSYAEIAAQNPRNISANKVSLARGKSFPVATSERIIIGPDETAKDNFPDSQATKDAALQCVDPVQLKMRVSRVCLGPQCSTIIEGSNLNPDSLKNCTALTEAGLEIKPEPLLLPRLIIHNIPVELSSEQILNSIVEQNLPDAAAVDIKVIYLYPGENKKFRSCVIATSLNHRLRLISIGKINISWYACRVEDHVSILQCFHCFGFGHVAGKCSKKMCCAKCASEHATKDCKAKDNMKCVNCSTVNHASVAHSASDRTKCPILRKKIERKIARTNYGGTQ